MRENYDTYAYFWVSEFDCKPEEISKLLGLEPTIVKLKGEPFTHGRLRRRSSWEYHSTLPRSEIFQDKHLSNLMVELLPRVTKIKDIGNRHSIGISCVGYYTNVNPGFHMSKELINQCAQLGVSIDFDLYNSNEPG